MTLEELKKVTIDAEMSSTLNMELGEFEETEILDEFLEQQKTQNLTDDELLDKIQEYYEVQDTVFDYLEDNAETDITIEK